MQAISAVVAIGGVYIAYLFYLRKLPAKQYLSDKFSGLNDFLLHGWNFDKLYELVFVKPIVALAHINKGDFIDGIYTGIANSALFFNKMLSKTQTGKIRWYIMGITVGAIVLIAMLHSL